MVRSLLNKRSYQDRYQEIIKHLDNMQSGAIIGLPLTGRGSFLRYGISNNFLKPKNKIIFIDYPQFIFTPQDYIHYIYNKISPLNENILKKQSSSVSILNSLGKIIKNIDPTTIIIFGIDKLIQNKKILNYFKLIWNYHAFENTPVNIILIGSLNIIYHPNTKFIRPILEEKLFYHNLLTDKESHNVYQVLCETHNFKPNSQSFENLNNLSHGHYMILKKLLLTTKNNPKNIKSLNLNNFPKHIKHILDKINRSIKNVPINTETKPDLEKIGYIQKGEQPFRYEQKSSIEKLLSDLTPQETIVFEYLKKNNEKIITREDIAKVIWGKEWVEKFSEWALDKLASNLRKKLSKHNYKLITIRNRGYKLLEKNNAN